MPRIRLGVVKALARPKLPRTNYSGKNMRAVHNVIHPPPKMSGGPRHTGLAVIRANKVMHPNPVAPPHSSPSAPMHRMTQKPATVLNRVDLGDYYANPPSKHKSSLFHKPPRSHEGW